MSSELTKRRLLNIEKILKMVSSDKIFFENITVLSEFVANELSNIEGSPVSPITIRRNTKYRALCDQKLGEESTSNSLKSSSNEFELKLLVRKLKIEIEGLEKQIAFQTQRILAIEHLAEKSMVDAIISNQSLKETPNLDQVYSILFRVMSASQGFEVSLRDGVVSDELSEKKIFSDQELPGFFEWYKKHVLPH